MADGGPPAATSFQGRSPLDTLLRETSARNPNPLVVVHTTNPPPPLYGYSSYAEPRASSQVGFRPPASPLLHGHFSRDSTATSSSNDNSSYLASVRTSVESRNYDRNIDQPYRYYDDESTYSDFTIRDSWQSNRSSGAVTRTPLLDGSIPPPISRNDSSPFPTIPTLIISSPPSDQLVQGSRSGRTPTVHPETTNLSRPIRPSPDSKESEERKRQVLQRNSRRETSPNSSNRQPSPANGLRTQPPSSRASSPNISSRSRSPLRNEAYYSETKPEEQRSMRASPLLSHRPLEQPISYPATSSHPAPLRPGSSSSLYSNSYSFYELNSAAPSPTDFAFLEVNSSDFITRPRAAPTPPPRTPSPSSPRQSTRSTHAVNHTQPKTAQEFLQLGIQHHEANRLKESALCFEESAKEGGGCGVGMLMYGLTLRHGWGCEKNEKIGFKWLSKAAEIAVKDLEDARSGGLVNTSAVQSELVLAIYEVGQCFFHGWGVAKDQKMGVSYYTVAARLGDADAQNDLAFCLANGKGCKKDRKEAAKWYRAAVAQGQSDIGLAWIYKEKFQ